MEAVRQMRPDDQDKIARLMLSLAEGDQSPEQTDPKHLPDILESLAQLRRGEFASDADVETVFRRFGS
ncbi:hypothetical protein [Allomesorhizobium camelthorni]|uniref:hypothetical protein n=1 Tax=Allomesorhizobium camelthorni TaxID=475069 RepID=UPI0031B59420